MLDLREDRFSAKIDALCSISAAVATAIGTLGSAAIGGISANAAANTQANAAKGAENTQLSMYNQTRSDLAPFMQGGQSAMSQLLSLFGLAPGGSGMPNGAAMTSALQSTPGYQFGLNQGTTAVNQSLASEGLLLSGAQAQALQSYGTNYALQQAYQPYISELNTLSSTGENAAAGVGTAGLATGQGVAASQLAAGQASAAGQVATGNILQQALSQGASFYGSPTYAPSAGNGYGYGAGYQYAPAAGGGYVPF